jgi:hypothetical protein
LFFKKYLQNHKLIKMTNYDEDEDSFEKGISDIFSILNSKFWINDLGKEFLESNFSQNNFSLKKMIIKI